MKQLLIKFLIAILIFIVVTVLFIAVLVNFPNMSDTQVYITIGIYLVLSQIGFNIGSNTK